MQAERELCPALFGCGFETCPVHPHSQGLAGESKGYKVHWDHGHLARGRVLDEGVEVRSLVDVTSVGEEVGEHQGDQGGGGTGGGATV